MKGVGAGANESVGWAPMVSGVPVTHPEAADPLGSGSAPLMVVWRTATLTSGGSSLVGVSGDAC